MKHKSLALLVSLSLCAGVMSPHVLAAQASTAVSYDMTQLAQNKTQLDETNLALKDLLSRADKALKRPVDPVVNKTLLPASGDKHDYYSFGPYWWPNPETKDGLPYIRKDGQTNPETKTEATDKQRMIMFAKDVTHLGLAYYFTDDQKYADKAIDQLKAWFIDEKTKMNPNMDYAQAIPGKVDGRGIGIIDSRLLIGVVDSVELLKPVLNDKDYQAIVAWFKDFNQWLLTSKNGFEEDNWHNNHGTWYDAQVVAFAIFTNDLEEAKKRLQITQMRRIGGHFDTEGKQKAELDRTRPWHYSNFNLEAYNLLGVYGEKLGVDVWNYEIDKHSLKKGYEFIASYVVEPDKWEYKEQKGMEPNAAYTNMLYAQAAYKLPVFDKSVAKLKQDQENQKKLVNLLF